MAKARQQLSGSPLQEVVEGVSGSLLHPDLIPVAPDLQTGQRNADVQGTVELKVRRETLSSSSTAAFNRRTRRSGVSLRSYPVHLVGHVQHAVDDGLIVLLVIQKLKNTRKLLRADPHFTDAKCCHLVSRAQYCNKPVSLRVATLAAAQRRFSASRSPHHVCRAGTFSRFMSTKEEAIVETQGFYLVYQLYCSQPPGTIQIIRVAFDELSRQPPLP